MNGETAMAINRSESPKPGVLTPRRVTLLASVAALGRVDKLNPDSDAGKQHEGCEALDQLVVAGGDTA